MQSEITSSELSRQEIIMIKVSKNLARLLYLFDCIGLCIKKKLFLFFWLIGLLFYPFLRKLRALGTLDQGKYFESQEKIKEAVGCYRAALEAYPNLRQANLCLCRCCLKLVLLDEALENCRIFLKQSPNHAQAYIYLGTILHYQGKDDEAVKCLNRAKELFPERYKYKAIVLIEKFKKRFKQNS